MKAFDYRSWMPQRRRALWIVLAVISFASVTAFRFVVSLSVRRNSDDANNFLAGIDLAHGNWRLHGWILAPDNLASTDILGEAALSAIFGPRPILMEALEALIWAGVVIIGIALATQRKNDCGALVAAAVALTLLALTVQQANPDVGIITKVGSHASTILLALATFWLADSIESNAKTTVDLLEFTALGVVLIVGSFADPLFLVVAALPVIVTYLLRVRGEARNGQLIAITALTIAAVGVARVLLMVNSATGGFHSDSLVLSFAPFEDIPNQLLFALRSVARLMGADFSGRSLTAQPISEGPCIFMLRFPFVLAFFAVLWQGGTQLVRDIRDWPFTNTRSQRLAYVDQLLWFSVVLSVTSAVVMGLFVDGTGIRFFLPAMVTGTILIARRFASVRLFAAYAMLALAGSVASEAAWVAQVPAKPAVVSAAESLLVENLERHGLDRGFGGYWESSINTVISDRHIRVLAVIEDLSHHLEPYAWFTNLDSYREAARDWHGRIFFISQQIPNAPLAISRDAVVGMFGHPLETLRSGDYLIDVYDMKPGALASLAPM
jgi:hypothetical protein